MDLVSDLPITYMSLFPSTAKLLLSSMVVLGLAKMQMKQILKTNSRSLAILVLVRELSFHD